jgi:hypothetical protein
MLMIQDLEWNGPGLPVLDDRRLFEELEAFRSIKVETVPAGPKYSAILEATGGRLNVSAGWAVPYLIEALDRGDPCGDPGRPPLVIAEVARRYRRGDRDSARDLFDRLLPILGWQNQHIDISNQFLKLLAVRQGIFAGANLRRPSVAVRRRPSTHRRRADRARDRAPRGDRLAAGMRAVRWHARGDVRLDDVLVPAPSEDEVLVRVEAAGICGTDVDEVRLGPITVPVRPHPISAARRRSRSGTRWSRGDRGRPPVGGWRSAPASPRGRTGRAAAAPSVSPATRTAAPWRWASG